MTDSTQARPTAAVVGGGVSGLTAAYLLSKTHHVTLFEADERVGGHAHTHDVPLGDGGTAPVDSGFIVLNDRTYPLLRRLFAELDVRTRPTEMSMSISLRGVWAELRRRPQGAGIFAQRRRVLDPTFWRMLLAISRFQKAALAPARRRAGEHPDVRRVPRPARLRPALRQPLRPADRVLRVVDGPPRGARLPRGVPVRVPAPPRLPGARRRTDLAHRGRRLPVVRRRDHQPARRRPHQHPRDGGEPQARRGRARRRAGRPPRVRQGRDRHPRRRRAAPAHRRRRGRDRRCSAPSATPPTSPTCTATRPCCPRGGPGGPAGTTGSRAATTTDRPQQGVLLDEPAPGTPGVATR